MIDFGPARDKDVDGDGILNNTTLRVMKRSERGKNVQWFLGVHRGANNGFNYYFLSNIPARRTLVAASTPTATPLRAISGDDEETVPNTTSLTKSAELPAMSGGGSVSVLTTGDEDDDWEKLTL